jgi:hypothetical protein
MYTYFDQAGKEIKLVHVLPGAYDDQISCELLKNISLHDVKNYDTSTVKSWEREERQAARLRKGVKTPVPPGQDYSALSSAVGRGAHN